MYQLRQTNIVNNPIKDLKITIKMGYIDHPSMDQIGGYDRQVFPHLGRCAARDDHDHGAKGLEESAGRAGLREMYASIYTYVHMYV